MPWMPAADSLLAYNQSNMNWTELELHSSSQQIIPFGIDLDKLKALKVCRVYPRV